MRPLGIQTPGLERLAEIFREGNYELRYVYQVAGLMALIIWYLVF